MSKLIDARVGAAVRALREKAGLGVDDVSRECGTTLVRVRDIEGGKTQCTAEELMFFVSRLGFDAHSLDTAPLAPFEEADLVSDDLVEATAKAVAALEELRRVRGDFVEVSSRQETPEARKGMDDVLQVSRVRLRRAVNGLT